MLCHIVVPVVEIFTADSATSKDTKEELLSSVQSCALACQSAMPHDQLQKIQNLIQLTMDEGKMATVSSYWSSDHSTVELTSLASDTSEAEVVFNAIMATLSYRMYHGMPTLLHCVSSCCTMLFPTPTQGASSIAELVSVNKLLGRERRAVILRYGMGLAEALKSIHSLEADGVLVDLIFKLLSSGVFTPAAKILQCDFHEEVCMCMFVVSACGCYPNTLFVKLLMTHTHTHAHTHTHTHTHAHAHTHTRTRTHTHMRTHTHTHTHTHTITLYVQHC